jgi:hypothetical protein
MSARSCDSIRRTTDCTCVTNWHLSLVQGIFSLATSHGHRLPQLCVDDSCFLFRTALDGDFCRTNPTIFGAEKYAFLLVMSEDRNCTRVKRMVAHSQNRTLCLHLFPTSIRCVLESMEGDPLCRRKTCIYCEESTKHTISKKNL